MPHASRPVLVVFVALLVAAVTWAIGWWGVVPVALVIGWYLDEVPWIGARTAAGALLGWAVLLAADALGGRFGALERALAGTLRMPAFVLVGCTLLLAAALGWTAAALGAAVRPLITGHRAEESAP